MLKKGYIMHYPRCLHAEPLEVDLLILLSEIVMVGLDLKKICQYGFTDFKKEIHRNYFYTIYTINKFFPYIITTK